MLSVSLNHITHKCYSTVPVSLYLYGTAVTVPYGPYSRDTNTSPAALHDRSTDTSTGTIRHSSIHTSLCERETAVWCCTVLLCRYVYLYISLQNMDNINLLLSLFNRDSC